MLKIIAKRLIALPVLTLILVTVVFFMIRLIPGDPALIFAGPEATREQVEAIVLNLGLDRPLYVQYWKYIHSLAQGDFGLSIRAGVPAFEWALSSIRLDILLAFWSVLLAVSISVPLGALAAVNSRTKLDAIIVAISLFGVSVPVYLSGLVFILIFSVSLGWFPVSGVGSWKGWVLPSLTIAIALCGELTRITRASMLDVLSMNYIRTAYSKGLNKAKVVRSHALRNGFIPVLSVIGEQFSRLLGAAVLTETIFGIPGLGRLLVDALEWRDYPVIQACMILFGVGVILVTLGTDILYRLVDPRINN